MRLNDYQLAAIDTAIYPKDQGIAYCALGLGGEAGECLDKVKKMIRDNATSDYDMEGIAKELGDVLWYTANLAHELGYSLETIAEWNVAKLASRKKRGKLQGSGDNR